MPLVVTFATFVLELVHVTVLFVALDGVIVACNFILSPTLILTLGLSILTLDTAISLPVTVTSHVASIPLLLLAIMMAVPALTPFTTPLESTVAILELLLIHVIFLFVALFGNAIVFIATLLPITKLILFLSILISLTGTTLEVSSIAAIGVVLSFLNTAIKVAFLSNFVSCKYFFPSTFQYSNI